MIDSMIHLGPNTHVYTPTHRTTDHMYYSAFAWIYGFVLFVVTLASCLAFVLSTMDAFTCVCRRLYMPVPMRWV